MVSIGGITPEAGEDGLTAEVDKAKKAAYHGDK